MEILKNKNKSILKIYLIYFICMCLFTVVRILYAKGLLFNSLNSISQDIVLTLIIQGLIMFLIPLLLYFVLLKRTPKMVFKTCNYEKISIVAIVISIGIGIVAYFGNVLISTVFSGFLTFLGYEKPVGADTILTDYTVVTLIVNIFTVAILPALGEEFLHRGVLLQGTKQIGFKKAILISALLFSFMHFNINQCSYAFIMGLILGIIAVASKNIWPAIIIHFINNLIGVLVEGLKGLFKIDLYSIFTKAFASLNFIIGFIFIFITLAVLVTLMAYLIFLLYKKTTLKRVKSAENNVYLLEQSNKKDELNNKPEFIIEKDIINNANFKKTDNPIDIILPKQPNKYKASFADNIFLYSALFLGAVITIFTFVWGVL